MRGGHLIRYPGTILVIAIAGALCVPVVAQTTFGTIVGTVTDSSGAVVPSAAVTVRNEGTNISQDTTANDRGDYSVSHLNPGTYSVSVSEKGLKRFTKTGIVLQTADTVRVDATLQVGELGVEVTVAGGGAPLVESEASNVAGIRTNEVMERLPVNTRGSFNGYFYTMLQLTPGAQQGSGSAFSMGGTRGNQNQFTLDGTTTNSPMFGNAIGPAQTTMESTGELRIDLANNKAEYSVPGEVTGTSKSGENMVHGSLFYYHDNGALNARNTFATSVPFAIGHDFGGSFGGPVYIPKLYNGKDKTFFFYTFESFPSRSQRVAAPNVPTLKFRAGDFSALPAGTVIKDPATGLPFPNNRIPADRLNAVSLAVQNMFYPLPNYGSADSYNGNFRASLPGHGFKHQQDVRIDHKISAANSIFGRFSYGYMGGDTAQSDLPAVGALDQHRKAAAVTIADTYIISPTTINEFRYGMVWNNNPFDLPHNGPALINQLGLQGLTPADVNSVPIFTITGFTGVTADNYWGWVNERAHNFVDNISWIRHDHTFKAGVEVRRNLGAQYPLALNNTLGNFGFSGIYTGFAYADFLLGIPQTSSRGNVAPVSAMVNTDVSAFFQDDWKVSRKLTLNLGVRYDVDPPYHEQQGRFFNFDLATGRVIVPQAGMAYVNKLFPTNLIPVVSAQSAGVSDSLFHTDWNNIAPRVGFSYRPLATADFVVRGGFGLFYDPNTASLYSVVTAGPFVSNESFTNSITNGVPLFQFPQAFPSGTGTIGSQSFSPIDPNLKIPYIEQWNLTVERELLHMGVRVSYIGTMSHHLTWSMNLNQPWPSLTPFNNNMRRFPNIRNVNYEVNGGNSAYNSLHVVAERKNRNGLYYQLGWTWAKNLTDDMSESDTGSVPENSYDRGRDRGNVPYMPRHRVVGQLLYTLPFGPGRPFFSSLHGVGRALAGGWTISSVLTAQTGTWFNPTFSGFDVSNTNTIGGRPDLLPGVSLTPANQTITNWFNAAAFAIPGCPATTPVCTSPTNVGRFGTAAQNLLSGPGLFAWNAGIHKDFTLHERARLLVQFTATNVINHVNYNNPSTNISSPATVGRITSAGAARTGEVAARIEF
jgi:Carboxypeptidase regulatory-like domain